MRLFGGERIAALMGRLNVSEDTPIQNSLLSNTIEGAQRKVEGRNFGIRKNVLQYDDVNNRQREIIYKQRDQVLEGQNLKPEILKMITQSIDRTVERYLPNDEDKARWNMTGLRDHYLGWLLEEDQFQYTSNEISLMTVKDVRDELSERAVELYQKREEEYGEEVIRKWNG